MDILPQLSINEAAQKLGVSTKTLRRWETLGRITPVRTPGGQRRYSLETLNTFQCQSQITNNKLQINSQNSNFHLQALSAPLMAPIQKQVLSFALAISILATGGVVIAKNNPKFYSKFFQKPLASKTQDLRSGNAGTVLAAESINDDYRFVVNIPALFNKDITAPNIIYGITAGDNVTISTGQNPTVSAVLPDQFKNFKVGSTTITANSKTDTLELVAGSNVTLST
ncbi:MerR family DNA-binding transcriptional regulator, partial [Candidatus Amesbacteria bacterium]|nr:MerR family DNA-binding transcriptional regulator [Candidatus Amesbacteria bacterium]